MTGDWQARLRADPTAWLLEKNNPSVRRLALEAIKSFYGPVAR